MAVCVGLSKLAETHDWLTSQPATLQQVKSSRFLLPEPMHKPSQMKGLLKYYKLVPFNAPDRREMAAYSNEEADRDTSC